MIDTNFYPLTISNITKETSDTVSISFTIDENLKSKFGFFPGQYLTLKADINGEDVRRSYSISSGKGGELRVAVKQIDKGVFSTYANQKLAEGNKLEVMPPTGNFVMKNQVDGKTSVFVAAGSGVTPILAMVRATLLTTEENVLLIYGNKDLNSIIYKSELDQLKEEFSERFTLHYVLSRDDSYQGYKGRINAELAKKIASEMTISDMSGVYLCGPEEMVKTVSEEFKNLGVASTNIHFELFFVAPSDEVNDAESELSSVNSKVTMIIDDEEFEFDLSGNGKNLLEAGQEAGADLPFGCKGGVCCTCKAKVMEGKAKMVQNYALEEEEVEQGFILACQAHPETKKLVVSFDEY